MYRTRITHIIHLPNGNVQSISQAGSVHLSNDSILINVLHVPGFQYNLPLVGQLARDSHITLIFYDTHHCL